MNNMTLDYDVSFNLKTHGRKVLHEEMSEKKSVLAGRVPRITRLLALAIQFEQWIKDGDVANCAEIARLGYVSRARLSQIMNLRLLAPEIQESLLDLPLVKKGRDSIRERAIRKITVQPDWDKQQKMWKKYCKQQD